MCGPGGDFACVTYFYEADVRHTLCLYAQARMTNYGAWKATRRQLSLSSQRPAIGHSAAGQPEGRLISRTGTLKELPVAG